MTEILTLADAVAELVRDGDTIALEGFTHLIPFAAGHEVIRQGRTDLTLVRMTPDLLYDQMIGMGVAGGLVFSYGGNPGVGSLHRFRDAIENGWPRPLEIEEHSHAGMANRYAAAAAGLPFAVMRGYVGTDLMERTRVARDRLPLHRRGPGRGAGARPRCRDRPRPGGRPGRQRPALGHPRRAEGGRARREAESLVTVERIVEALEPRPGGVIIPGWTIDAVAAAPGGSRPSYSLGVTDRDNDFYRLWDEISRDRDAFRAWMEDNVLAAGVEAR